MGRRFAVLVGVVTVPENSVASINEKGDFHLLEEKGYFFKDFQFGFVVFVSLNDNGNYFFVCFSFEVADFGSLFNQDYDFAEEEHQLFFELLVVVVCGGGCFGFHFLEEFEFRVDFGLLGF